MSFVLEKLFEIGLGAGFGFRGLGLEDWVFVTLGLGFGCLFFDN